MTARRPDAATRRAQLLDAADAVFTEFGVNAALDLIVERAAVGRATLYRQFPDRQAILLVGGDKSGGSEKRFYKQLIARADDRFDRHLAQRKG